MSDETITRLNEMQQAQCKVLLDQDAMLVNVLDRLATIERILAAQSDLALLPYTQTELQRARSAWTC